jgi:hypothetical protein
MIIYMPLLDEGTDVWRPVEAVHEGGDVYLIVSEQDHETETWEFPTGTRVRCHQRSLSGGVCLVAYTKAVD